jgi:hypothetical protein
MITIAINSDAEIAVNLKSAAGDVMTLADVHDLVITFFVIGTNKKVVRFRKTPNVEAGDKPIVEADGLILLRWNRAFTEGMVPCVLRMQHTEMYTDSSYDGELRKTTTEVVDAIRLVPNENVDAL